MQCLEMRDVRMCVCSFSFFLIFLAALASLGHNAQKSSIAIFLPFYFSIDESLSSTHFRLINLYIHMHVLERSDLHMKLNKERNKFSLCIRSLQTSRLSTIQDSDLRHCINCIVYFAVRNDSGTMAF